MVGVLFHIFRRPNGFLSQNSPELSKSSNWLKSNRTMEKRKHYIEEEIICILKKADNALPITDLLRKI